MKVRIFLLPGFFKFADRLMKVERKRRIAEVENEEFFFISGEQEE
jgi:hypothetical protein